VRDEAGFLSLAPNDLTPYTLAMDRGHSDTSGKGSTLFTRRY